MCGQMARRQAVSADALAYTADDGNFDERSGRIELMGLVDSEPFGVFAKAISMGEGDYHWSSISVWHRHIVGFERTSYGG